MSDLPDPLVLRARPKSYALVLVGMCAALLLRIWLEDHRPDRLLPWWDWLFVGPALAGIAWGTAFLAWPPTLTLDDRGIALDQIGYHRKILWVDVERVGIATKPVPDLTTTYVHSAASGIVSAARIGIDYKPGRNPIADPGKQTYRQGFYGYDVALMNWTNHDVGWIIDRMNERLEAARRDALA